MSKLTAAQITKIHGLMADVQFYGTKEKGYTDSGLWIFLRHVYTKDEHDDESPVYFRNIYLKEL